MNVTPTAFMLQTMCRIVSFGSDNFSTVIGKQMLFENVIRYDKDNFIFFLGELFSVYGYIKFPLLRMDVTSILTVPTKFI